MMILSDRQLQVNSCRRPMAAAVTTSIVLRLWLGPFEQVAHRPQFLGQDAGREVVYNLVGVNAMLHRSTGGR